jgi:hypothetical protein
MQRPKGWEHRLPEGQKSWLQQTIVDPENWTTR